MFDDMKQYCILILCAFPFVLISQSHYSIGVMGGLDYTFSSLESEDVFTGETKPELGYRFGLNAAIKIAGNMALEFGARYVKHSYRNEGKIYALGTDHNGNGGFELMLTDQQRSGFTYTHTFLEIPVNLKYVFSTQKLSPYIIIGLSPNFYLNSKTEATYSNQELTKSYNSSDLKQVTLSVNSGFGIDFLIQNNLVLFAQTGFRYHITDFSTGINAEHLYSAGLELGIRKNLN